MEKNIRAGILAKLSRAAVEDELIYSVCQQTGLDWENARALVAQVKSEHRDQIEARQVPIKSLLALVFSASGLVLAVGPLIYLGIILDITGALVLMMTGGSSAPVETALQLFWNRCALLSWFQLPSILFTSLLGLAIVWANQRAMGENLEILLRKGKKL